MSLGVCRILDGIEISDVQLGDAAVVNIPAGELERVPDRLVTLANAAARVHRDSVANVDYADQSHGFFQFDVAKAFRLRQRLGRTAEALAEAGQACRDADLKVCATSVNSGMHYPR